MAQDGAGAGTLAERLAGEIAERIIAGELPAGARLDEQTLADRHGMSRTPVREAIRQLQATGLIEMRPRRGAIVAQPTRRDIEDLFVAMGEIEASCARLAALCMTPIERRRLQAQHEAMGAMAADGALDAYAEANVAMHGAIYAGAHNAALAEIALNLRRRLAPFRRAQFRAPGRLELLHREHARVVEAIIEGRAAEAHAAMLHHVTLVEISAEAVASAGQARRDDR
jgi:DNA-binding GntR family transcriptional regulator